MHFSGKGTTIVSKNDKKNGIILTGQYHFISFLTVRAIGLHPRNAKIIRRG